MIRRSPVNGNGGGSKKKVPGKKKSLAGKGKGQGGHKDKDVSKFIEAGKPFRWADGESGNPAGSSKKQALSTILASQMDEMAERVPDLKELAEKYGLDPKKTTIGYVLMMSTTFNSAKSGDPRAAEMILDRLEGRVSFQLETDNTSRSVNITSTRKDLSKLTDKELNQRLKLLAGADD